MTRHLFITAVCAMLVWFCAGVGCAVPAFPGVVEHTQPDGSVVSITIKGDERLNWYETLDEYTLLADGAGNLCYAELDGDGNLAPSSDVATDVANRPATMSKKLSMRPKKLFFSEAQVELSQQIFAATSPEKLQSSAPAVPGKTAAIGSYKTICALVNFPGLTMTKTKAQFENLMNQIGYSANGDTGSVRDFFRESSYGKFDLQVTLCGPYTAPESASYYGGTSGMERGNILAAWIAAQVVKDIDLSGYDSDNDGVVDGFHFLFAGVGKEASTLTNTIWSHKWQFTPAVVANGKSMSVYSCSPELYNGNITTIGVVCHEMSHAFGAPDFYDTNGSTGGSFTGTGDWDMMANGSWNGSSGRDGNKPAHHNMYQKVQYGWVTPTVLSGTTTITGIPNSAQNAVAYRINTQTVGEYYLLDNRQQFGFDTYVPGSGLLIYHVSANMPSGGINETHPQKMYPVCASSTYATPNSTSLSYGTINSAGCPFPGTASKTMFSDTTTPNMKSWAGVNTGSIISNITSGSTIGFSAVVGTAPPYDVPAGVGTAADPYRITVPGNLVWMGENVGASSGKHYKLMNDIDMSVSSTWNLGAGFPPIGSASNAFRGTFEGNNKKITNLHINITATATVYAGLFGYINGATIRDLGVAGGSVTVAVSGASINAYAGGLLGCIYGTNSITNCYATGNVTATSTGTTLAYVYAGGLAGRADVGTISNCYATGNVLATATGAALTYAGGLFAVGSSPATNSYATGNVTATAVSTQTVAGGFGGITSGAITNCYSRGAVSATSSGLKFIGGLLGSKGSPTGATTNCYWNTQTSGQTSSAGGTGKTTAQMQQADTFTNWDFATVWYLTDSAYPRQRVFATDTGAITVTLQSAVADAQWRIAGAVPTRTNFATTVSGIPIGTYTVEFSTVPNYDTPASCQVTITPNTTTPIAADYRKTSIPTGETRQY